MSKNICIRCGKERIVGQKVTEKVEIYSGASVIVRTQMICPDPDCQQAVEKELEDAKLKREALKKESEQRQAYRRHAH